MPTMTSTLYPLGPVASIPPGEGRTFRLEDGREIAVFLTRDGGLFATQARCPHKGAPLADGLVGGGRVVCPFHAYAFELATGEAVMNSCPALATYAIHLGDDDMLYAALDEQSGQSCAD